MQFAHDTRVALTGAAALVNTRPWPGSSEIDAAGEPTTDDLRTVADLRAFMDEWGWTGAPPRTAAEVEDVRALRGRLHRFWELDEDAVVEVVNELLREYRALPQLVRHDAWDYHLHATPSGAPPAARMAVEAAMAMVDLVRAGELGRLGTCAGEDCGGVVVDLSRNRSRRYCEDGCGNRAAVTAYRARRAAPTTSTT